MIDKLCKKLLSPWILAAVTALLLVAVSFQDHIAPEEGVCFYTAQQWISSDAPLYTSLGDSAQPGIIFVCALFYALFGNNIIAARLISVLFVLLAQWFVYAISCKVYCRIAGLIAMGIFGIMMTWPDITNGFSITPDLFVVTVCSASLYLLIRSCETQSKLSHYIFIVFSGIMLGIVVLFKQTALFSVLGIIAIYYSIYMYKKASILKVFAEVVCILGASTIVIGGGVYFLSLQGTMIHDYMFCSWSSLQYFLPESWYEWTKDCLFTFQRRNIIVMYPCVMLFVVLRKKIVWKQRLAIGLICWFVLELIASILWGLLFEFDLTQLVLVSSLIAGCALAFLLKHLSQYTLCRNTLLLILGIIIIGIPYETIYKEKRHSFLLRKKNHYAFFGRWLDAQTEANEPVLIATPWAPQVYFYSERKPPVRFVRRQYLDVQPLENEFLADLDANPPEHIVLPEEGDIPEWLRPYITEKYKRKLYTSLWIKHNCKIYQKKVSE